MEEAPLAATSSEHTNYFFDVNTDGFEEALDRFAQFFTKPLMSADATMREIKAVDSENQKKSSRILETPTAVVFDQLAITAAVLAGFSDGVAQKIAGANKLQLRRLLLFMVPDTWQSIADVPHGPL